jgi:tRNA U34 5-methylaminomethyl-2-thiouridine-forming methyltransferase MnmC
VIPQDVLSLEVTADGSRTFFSQKFQECFHSTFGAKEEAELKFVLPVLSHLNTHGNNSTSVCLIDLCYGLGYNTAAALEYCQFAGNLRIIGLENNIEVPQAAHREGLLDIWQPETREILANLAEHQTYRRSGLDLQLIIGDARQTINQIPLQTIDGIFFDPFSPKKCPQLWTIDFLKSVSDRLKPNGYLVTYSCAAAFRATLKNLGLHLWSTIPLGRKAPGTIASWNDSSMPARSQNLSVAEQEILETRAGIPYRDPELKDTANIILARRESEQNSSNLRSTSNWLKQCSKDWQSI